MELGETNHRNRSKKVESEIPEEDRYMPLVLLGEPRIKISGW
jgi:hypothetical protein